MYSIESILRFMHKGVSEKHDRFKVIDDETVMDMNTGITLHLYDDWFKMTYDGKPVIMQNDFTPTEQEIVWGIKQAITDPSKARERQALYPVRQKERRAMLSECFEHPKPLVMKGAVEVEEDTHEYTG